MVRVLNLLTDIPKIRRNYLSEDLSSYSDSIYKKKVEHILKPSLYKKHVETNYISCVFCSHLKPASCHVNCYSCSKKTYELCGTTLPGINNYTGKGRFLSPSARLPWAFCTPCNSFERLDEKKYLLNISPREGILSNITAYETLEGLYFGICNGSVPCHICATVNADIYNDCLKKRIMNPCKVIFDKLEEYYKYSIIK